MMNKVMAAWAGIGLVFWTAYFITQPQDRHLVIFYYHTWLLLFGVLAWSNRTRIRAAVQRWSAGGFKKFLLLGLMMVAIEEVLAALFNHLDEGFRFIVFLQRIGQFELFNLWVFCGLFIGAYFVIRKIAFSEREIFYLFGIVGLFTEGVAGMLLSAPMAFFFTAPIVVLTYGLVITPAMMGIPLVPRRETARPLKYPLFILSTLVVGALFVGTLMLVAKSNPWLIPPHTRNF